MLRPSWPRPTIFIVRVESSQRAKRKAESREPRAESLCKTALILLVASALSCSSPTDLKRPPGAVDVTMEFCSGQGPNWLAYKNDGQDWVSVPANLFVSSYTFPATPKITIAYARAVAFASYAQVSVFNLTADEVQQFRCPLAVTGVKELTGTVKTINANDDARVLMGGAISFVFPGVTTYSLFVREGPLDLFALIRPFPANASADPLVIVRHNVDLPAGGAIPLLDFTSTEAKPFETSTINVEGSNANGSVLARVNYVSSRRTDFALGGVFNVGPALAISAVPASLLEPGDLHRVSVSKAIGSATLDIIYYQHAPHDTTVTFGPTLTNYTIDLLSSTPIVQTRVRFGSQPSYPSFAQALLQQSDESSYRSVSLLTTAGYAGGTPGTWELSVPDITNAPGYLTAWGLVNGAQTSVAVKAWNARTAVFLGGGTPTAGETMRAATASSSIVLSR